MAARIRPWQALAAALALAVLTGATAVFVARSRPPRFTARDFTSLRCVFPNHDQPPLEVTTDDAALVAAVADSLHAGWVANECRCVSLARLAFRRPDGTSMEVSFVPAHDLGTVEFEIGGERYRMASAAFLRVVEPLGVPAERWTGSIAR